MKEIRAWLTEFWARPTATRAAVIVAFLGISSLYCLGIATVVAGGRLRSAQGSSAAAARVTPGPGTPAVLFPTLTPVDIGIVGVPPSTTIPTIPRETPTLVPIVLEATQPPATVTPPSTATPKPPPTAAPTSAATSPPSSPAATAVSSPIPATPTTGRAATPTKVVATATARAPTATPPAATPTVRVATPTVPLPTPTKALPTPTRRATRVPKHASPG